MILQDGEALDQEISCTAILGTDLSDDAAALGVAPLVKVVVASVALAAASRPNCLVE